MSIRENELGIGLGKAVLYLSGKALDFSILALEVAYVLPQGGCGISVLLAVVHIACLGVDVVVTNLALPATSVCLTPESRAV